MTTIGIDFGVTKVKIKERELKINIFDMAGHTVFYDVRNEFYKGEKPTTILSSFLMRLFTDFPVYPQYFRPAVWNVDL